MRLSALCCPDTWTLQHASAAPCVNEAPRRTAAAAEGRRTAQQVQQHAAAARGLCRGTRLGGG
eukprot:7642830-Alexandrium_andersonii.AAC.1